MPLHINNASSYKKLTQALLVMLVAMLLSACGTVKTGKLQVNNSVQAQGHNSRIKVIVLHYTVSNTAHALKTLSTKNVSSHYVVSDSSPPVIYQLVDENRRAWHAGISHWFDNPDINNISIGIEIVNAGPHSGGWASYPEEQINSVIELVRDIAKRHQIEPRNIVGHSDIAPQRKQDPGPLFPWKRLAQEGLGLWYNEAMARQTAAELQHQTLPSVSWLQAQLRHLGYKVPLHGVLDQETQNVISAFQMRYRPQNHNGQPDIETIAILSAMPQP